MDGAIAVLTLALVVITGYYAWQNRQMVDEMRLSREAGARPHLALCFEPLGPMNVMVGLINLGPGAALSIDLTIFFHPRSGSSFSGETQRWRGELLAAGAQRDFFVPGSTGKMMTIQQLAAAVDRIEMTGTMRDVLGAEHTIRGGIGALDEWDELLRNAHGRYKEPSLDRLVNETAKLSKAVDKAVSKWTSFGGGLHVRSDADLVAEREEWMKEVEQARADSKTPTLTVCLCPPSTRSAVTPPSRQGHRVWSSTTSSRPRRSTLTLPLSRTAPHRRGGPRRPACRG